MAYIGKQPTVGNFVKLDAITTSATATYNLLNGGVAYSPQSPNHCIVSLNGVIQSPTTSFTISGSTIVFASALTATDVIDFILVLGDVLNIGTPSDATVGFSKVTSNLITGATAVTAPATDDVLLCYDTSATALRKITFADFGNTPAFEAHRSTDQTIADLTSTKVQFDTELFDTDSAYDNVTNYRFTPQVAGKYFVYSQLMMSDTTGTFKLLQVNLDLKKNGSTLRSPQMYFNALATHYTASVYGSVDMNGSSDYLEIFVLTRRDGGGNSKVNGSNQSSFFGAYRLIGV
jgi:hypothetical protein